MNKFMLSLSPIYIFIQALGALGSFFRHWYLGGFYVFAHRLTSVIVALEQTFALRVTLRNLFKPLYQDYTVMGVVLGFIFRPLRLLIGGLLYVFVALLCAVLYGVWAAIPVFLFVKTIVG